MDVARGRRLCRPASSGAVQGRPIESDLQAGDSRSKLRPAPQAAGQAAPGRARGRPRISGHHRAWGPRLSRCAELRPVPRRGGDRNALLRDGDGRGPNLLGSGLSRCTARGARGLFRRDERDHRRAPSHRSRGCGPRRLWQAGQLFRPADRPLVEAISRRRRGRPARGDGQSRGMAPRKHPPRRARAARDPRRFPLRQHDLPCQRAACARGARLGAFHARPSAGGLLLPFDDVPDARCAGRPGPRSAQHSERGRLHRRLLRADRARRHCGDGLLHGVQPVPPRRHPPRNQGPPRPRHRRVRPCRRDGGPARAAGRARLGAGRESGGTLMVEGERAGWTKRLKLSLGQIGPVRLVITILLLAAGLYLARHDWQVPLLSDAERALYDLRFKVNAAVLEQPDDRIALVVYDDATLEQLGKRSPLDRGMLARALRALDRLGPRAIGIDILIDQQQPEDEQLIQALRTMRTPTWLAFSTNEANPAQIAGWQEDWLRSFFTRVGSSRVRPASIRFGADQADGVMRRWPVPDSTGVPLLANAMASGHPAFVGYTGAIDFTLLPQSTDARRFTRISVETLGALDEIPAEAREIVFASLAEQIRGRYVLIGGDINDVDDFETPTTRFGLGFTKGLEVHAQMLAQQLDGRMPRPIPGWVLWLAALAVVVAGSLTSGLELRGWRLGAALFLQIALIAWVPFQLQAMRMNTLELPAFGWGAGWLLAFIGVGAAARAVGSEQRRFAQSALGKYLPRDVAQEIMRDPDRLALTGEKTRIYALFTDLEGFTKLSHAITPETLSRLLNRYLDVMSDIVLKHGGTLDKFVGDALVTFWGAPIARDDDADRAVRAGRAMYEAGESFRSMAREIAGEDIPPIGVTRVGLHRGEAVVGNFGGEGRIQYTALGDAMNTAARLESANKALKTTMLVSDEAKRESTVDYFRPMGRIVLSGRATPVMVWEPVPDMDPAFVRQLNEIWERFDAGDG